MTPLPPTPPLDTAAIEDAFRAGLAAHGERPEGVLWNSVAAQERRFEQLARLLPPTARFSLIDYGCGYGALADYLARRGFTCDYLGYDLLPEMVAAAQRRAPHAARFTAAAAELPPVDYVVASGIFNLRAAVPDGEWLAFILRTLDRFDALSRRGFAFNALTRYSDPPKMRPELYYADPLRLFDHCKTRYARNVALLHDYDLYDFTILVRKA
jgi:SAM-dependent methyltransferase